MHKFVNVSKFSDLLGTKDHWLIHNYGEDPCEGALWWMAAFMLGAAHRFREEARPGVEEIIKDQDTGIWPAVESAVLGLPYDVLARDTAAISSWSDANRFQIGSICEGRDILESICHALELAGFGKCLRHELAEYDNQYSQHKSYLRTVPSPFASLKEVALVEPQRWWGWL